MLLVRTAITALVEKLLLAIPRAVPLAGGCSTSSATISKMEIPTASEYTIMVARKEGCGIRAHSEPRQQTDEMTANDPSRLRSDASRRSEYNESC